MTSDRVPFTSFFCSPPDGCLQYHTGLTGRFTTFNFDATSETHLQNQA